MLTHIVETCQTAEHFINRTLKPRSNVQDSAEVKTYILSPENDPLINQYSHIPIITGSEEDVLGRYANLVRQEEPDFVVRITSDCPHHQSHVISRHIKAAIKHKQKYTTNTIWRTEMEGMDTEVLSSDLILWLDRRLINPGHREHVTSYIADSVRSMKFPFIDYDFRICHVLDKYDKSFIKTSVDTEDDYRKTIECHNAIEYKIKQCKLSGQYVI
jgi:spore coat polysaccharide biosynthesis protein SpsF